jgi:hypothetical protein
LGVVALFAVLSLWSGFTPLYDEAAAPGQRVTSLFRGLTPGLLLLFLASGSGLLDRSSSAAPC